VCSRYPSLPKEEQEDCIDTTGAEGSQAAPYNPLQAENSGYSDTSQAQPSALEREQSSEAVLAEIFGITGTPSGSGRPADASTGNKCLSCRVWGHSLV